MSTGEGTGPDGEGGVADRPKAPAATEVTRRRLLRDASAVGGAALIAGAMPAHAIARRRRRRTVAILGGGVGGLTAAHELAERGFEVTVFERRGLGGKARSVEVPGSARGGRQPLPGEHGFRFFPGFYQNLPDTMRRIPYGSNPRGVFDNLVAASQLSMARSGGRSDLILPVSPEARGWDLEHVRQALVAWLEHGTQLPPHEIGYFVERLLVFFTSCDARRFGEWEHISWWEFTAAERFSEDYRRLLVHGVTRQLLAAKGTAASARTLGLLWEAFFYNLTGRSGTGYFDRLLDAPTNEAWIDPWVARLRDLGVSIKLDRHVEGLELRDGRIAGAHVKGRRGRETVRADWFVCALPAERARRLWSRAILATDPGLRRMRSLRTDWMNGIQFYLRDRLPVIHGHVLYIDSPWALSSVSQAQFWEGQFARRYGDGSVNECLSVDIGDWSTPGILYGKPARELRPAQVAREVFAQMKAHLNDTGRRKLSDDMIVSWFLDPGLIYRRRRGGNLRPRSQDPLLINTPGSWDDRPEAATAVRNLFLASDYVRVNVDLACMEGANEAARRAVNALLSRGGFGAAPCKVYELYRPPELEALKRIDAEGYRHGRPNALDTEALTGSL